MVPEERVTARMDEEKAAQFEESVKTLGIDEPIRCFDVNGVLWLSDGLHRLVFAIKNKINSVDVLVKPGTERDVLFHNLRSGHLRGKHPVSEMRKQIEKAYKEFNVGIEDIVKESGLTQDYVEKLLLISELTPMCLEALDQERIGVGQACELLKARSPDQQEVFLQMCFANNWKLPALREFIKQTLAIGEQRAAAPTEEVSQPPATVPCRFCGDEYPPAQLASLIMCHTCQGIMFEAVAIARRETQQVKVPEQWPPIVPKQ